MRPSSEYKSYLLRLWAATQDGEPVWRASLQNTATGQRQGFPDLASLFAYLRARVTPDGLAEPPTENRPDYQDL